MLERGTRLAFESARTIARVGPDLGIAPETRANTRPGAKRMKGPQERRKQPGTGEAKALRLEAAQAPWRRPAFAKRSLHVHVTTVLAQLGGSNSSEHPPATLADRDVTVAARSGRSAADRPEAIHTIV